MYGFPGSRDHYPMDDREERARGHDEENRQGFVIRREERNMAHVERQLEREMEAFRDAEQHTEHAIEDQWRDEHWGLEPERPPRWRPPDAPSPD